VHCGIQGDLTRLFNNCGFNRDTDPPFVGALELGDLAKEKNAVSRANIGLVDLSSLVLRKYLLKDPAVRISEGWNLIPLSDAHMKYAALDVYATWKIFEAQQVRTHGLVVNDVTPGGTPVYLHSSDHSQPVAWGHIALDRPKHLQGINITKSRVPVVIQAVLVPGHFISGDLLPTRKDTALSDFPHPPYTLICKSKHVRTRSESDDMLRCTASEHSPALESDAHYISAASGNAHSSCQYHIF